MCIPMSIFPFCGLDDVEFDQLIDEIAVYRENGVSRIPLDQLKSMKLNVYDCQNGRFTIDDNLDLSMTDLYSKVQQNSNYYFDNIPSFDKESFSIFSHNINSLPNHYDELVTLLETELRSKFDVIALCECKLTDDIGDLYNIAGYSMFTNNTSRNSGGLALYIDGTHDKSFIRSDLNISCIDTESLLVEIPSRQKKYSCRGNISKTWHKFCGFLYQNKQYSRCIDLRK